MPTIRVDDDVLEALKSIAEPFIDTPNSVIRRLLAENGLLATENTTEVAQKARRQQAKPIEKPISGNQTLPAETLTPQPIYESFLLYVLWKDFHGRATRHDATKAVISLMKKRGFITPADIRRVSTGETKAENTVAWGRNALKDRGLIDSHSERGTWELTADGLKAAQMLTLPNASPKKAG